MAAVLTEISLGEDLDFPLEVTASTNAVLLDNIPSRPTGAVGFGPVLERHVAQ